ncbi:MAG: phosphatidate cytidylyltransferase, partial [Planctomycetota bacterium]
VLPLLLLLGLPVILGIRALGRPPGRDAFREIAVASLGIIAIVIPLMFCLLLRLKDRGEWWVLLVLLLVKGNDIGAYLVGSKLGRTPLHPISPKKTVEGSIAGWLLGVLVACALIKPLGLNLFEGCFLGALGGIAGQVGDLAESFLKRSWGVKNSGALVPSFGGALDLLDSVLGGAPVIYLVAAWMGH